MTNDSASGTWYRCALLAILLLSGERAGMAQEQGQSTQPSLSVSEFTLWNDSANRLAFVLRDDDNDWTEFHLDPQSQSTYRHAKYIRISTKRDDGSSVTMEYRLEYQKRYRLAHNSSKNCWDVFLMTPR